MHGALDLFEPERLVRVLAVQIIELGIGGELTVAPLLRPLLGCRHQQSTNAVAAYVRIDIPAFHMRCRPRAALGVISNRELEEPGEPAPRPLADEHLRRNQLVVTLTRKKSIDGGDVLRDRMLRVETQEEPQPLSTIFGFDGANAHHSVHAIRSGVCRIIMSSTMVASGARLGPYQIISQIGAGGMGEVWRARDTRLDRDVAIKILPAALASNAQFKLRFEREARTISQLNHSHICVLHDVGEAKLELSGGEDMETGDGAPTGSGASPAAEAPTVSYLVMELLEGESLADRISKGPLPLPEVLRYGAQIAEALDRAHRAGVVHRDLKPGNIMITKSGAKLLDFGLAKSGSFAIPPPGLSNLPTEHKPLTQEGAVLGTFQYMSPEQLAGEEADSRSDIWALGCVLYEMSTGSRAFKGKNRTSLIGAIVGGQPQPVAQIRPQTPPPLDHLIVKCLEKDPDDRWQSAHDIAEELRWFGEAGSQAGAGIGLTRRGLRRRIIAGALLLAGIALGAGAHWWLARQIAPSPPVFQYIIEYGSMYESRPALSPDGRVIAYSKDGMIHLRSLARLESTPLSGTEGGSVPFWSPDGNWLGFAADGKLWKIQINGGSRTLLGSVAPGVIAGGASWLPDGRIILDTGRSGLMEISDRGGDPREILKPGENEADFHFVSALPDDKGFLFVVHQADRFDNITLWDGHERRILFQIPAQIVSSPVYAESGHILFNRAPEGAGIWALPFSLDRLEVTGDAFPVAPFGASPSVAGSTLVYTPIVPPTLSEIVEVDRTGRVLRSIGPPRRGLYPGAALSPDGKQLVVPIVDAAGSDLWLFDVTTGEATRLTFHESPRVESPVWSPDGTEIFYTHGTNTEDFALHSVRIDRSGSREIGKGTGPVTFADGGRTMLYNLHSKGFDWDLWHKQIDTEGPGEALLADPGWELRPSLSPDGRFILYDKSGDILIRTYPEMGGPWQVATGGAAVARWSRRGDRIFYLSRDHLMEVPVTLTASGVRVGTPRTLLPFVQAPTEPSDPGSFALAPDEESLFMIRPVERPPGIVVVQNWLALVDANR